MQKPKFRMGVDDDDQALNGKCRGCTNIVEGKCKLFKTPKKVKNPCSYKKTS